jgi:hypothetical protein
MGLMNEGSNIMGYRVIIDRRTGEYFTDPTPIYAEDWPYSDVLPNQPLLRYMDVWKFEDLCKSRALYFRRADKFDDPLEGTLSTENIHGKSASDVAFSTKVTIAPTSYADLVAYRNVAKAVTFVNCWHINNNECPKMWDQYTSSPDSLVVISTTAHLKTSLKQPVFMSAVKYIKEDKPRTEFDERSLFFYKDIAFEHEREYRLLIDLADFGGSIQRDDPVDFFRKVPVDPLILVRAIQTHPQATKDTYERIGALVREYLPGIVAKEDKTQ